MLLSGEGAILSTSLPGKMIVLYIVGVIAIIGCLAMIAEAVVRVLRGPGGWLVRTGEVLVAIAAALRNLVPLCDAVRELRNGVLEGRC